MMSNIIHLDNAIEIVFITSSLIILSIYIQTLSPSIAGGDSGEIVAEGCQLGTAHPPGYPLITLIIYFLTHYLQFGTPAYVINVFSAICTSMAAYFIGKTIYLISSAISQNSFVKFGFVSGSILAMFLFSLSPLIWQYAVTAEVFPLNTMFAAWIVYLVVSFSKTRSLTTAYLGAFISGLAFCNQHTILLFEAPLVLWMLILLRRNLLSDVYVLIKLAIAYLVGFSFYFYLPIASMLKPTRGSWGNVVTFNGFLHHFLRKDYGTLQLYSGNNGKATEGFWERNEAYFKDFSEVQGLNFSHWLALIGIISVLLYQTYTFESETPAKPITIPIVPTVPASTPSKSSKGSRKASNNIPIETPKPTLPLTTVSLISSFECSFTPLILIVTLGFYFGIFHTLANLPLKDKLLYGVHQRFWMQPNILSFMLTGLGFNLFFKIIEYVIEKMPTSKNIRSSFYMILIVLSFGSVLMVSRLQYTKNVFISDQSQANYFHEYARAILEPLPKNSILLINYDQQWTSTRYLQVCEGFRPDVTAIQLSMMTYSWFESKRKLYNKANDPTYQGPDITFPGTYLTFPNSALIKTEKAFTLRQFLYANLPKNISVFIGGKHTFKDPLLDKEFELVPVGLVSQYIPANQVPNGALYSQTTFQTWQSIHDLLYPFPSDEKYSQETWEWTIYRDFKDRLLDTSSFLLMTAIPIASQHPQALINALYWTETAHYLESNDTVPTNVLKNLGLGHIHLIQNKILLTNRTPQILPTADIFQSIHKMNWPLDKSWRDWSAMRFAKTWGEFLQREDAKLDAQYETMLNMYNTVMKSSSTRK